MLSPSFDSPTRGHRVRELVCAYRPLRDHEGRVVSVTTLALSNPKTAAATLGPLLGDEPVEVFAVACLSTKHRLLAWHLLSRGTREHTRVDSRRVRTGVSHAGHDVIDRHPQPSERRSHTESR